MPGSILDAENTAVSIDTLFLPLMKLLVQLGKKIIPMTTECVEKEILKIVTKSEASKRLSSFGEREEHWLPTPDGSILVGVHEFA